jgi:hypothetical protein
LVVDWLKTNQGQAAAYLYLASYAWVEVILVNIMDDEVKIPELFMLFLINALK